MDFRFLKSVRFWKLFIVAAVGFAAGQGYVPQEVAGAVAVWLGGSVVVRTVDRFSDQ
jgi:hypothetical protein